MKKASKEQKAVIHILKNKYDISDEYYKNMIYEKYGVYSSVDLVDMQALEFIHYLNMEYNEDYKRGYIMGISKCLESENKPNDLFKKLVKIVHGSEPTSLEYKMFERMSCDQQQLILEDLKAKI